MKFFHIRYGMLDCIVIPSPTLTAHLYQMRWMRSPLHCSMAHPLERPRERLITCQQETHMAWTVVGRRCDPLAICNVGYFCKATTLVQEARTMQSQSQSQSDWDRIKSYCTFIFLFVRVQYFRPHFRRYNRIESMGLYGTRPPIISSIHPFHISAHLLWCWN